MFKKIKKLSALEYFPIFVSVSNTRYISIMWKRLAIIFLIAFAIQIVNKALCYHTHIIDGRLYSHAHPGSQDTQHSEYELSFYAQLQVLNASEIPDLLSDVILIFNRKIEAKHSSLLVNTVSGTRQGRAPPVA